MEILFWIVIYTIVVLLFVPLTRIGRMQTAVKKWAAKAVDKIKS